MRKSRFIAPGFGGFVIGRNELRPYGATARTADGPAKQSMPRANSG